MSRTIELECHLDLDPTLAVAERFGVVIADTIDVRLVVKYLGISVVCDSLDDLKAFALEAIMRHAKARWATKEEALAAGRKVIAERPELFRRLAEAERAESAVAVGLSVE